MNARDAAYWPPVLCAYCGKDVSAQVMAVRTDHTDAVLDYCDLDHYWRWVASSLMADAPDLVSTD
jgi:hypothetical protein